MDGVVPHASRISLNFYGRRKLSLNFEPWQEKYDKCERSQICDT